MRAKILRRSIMGSTADRIKDIGPQPQSFDIERATKENTNYRSVAWSGRYLQVTLMSIPAGGDIGLEAHPETDQFLRLDAGSGRVQMLSLIHISEPTRLLSISYAVFCLKKKKKKKQK